MMYNVFYCYKRIIDEQPYSCILMIGFMDCAIINFVKVIKCIIFNQ